LNIRIWFPRLLPVCFALLVTLCATGIVAGQSSEADSRQTRTILDSNGATRLETEMSTPGLSEERRPRVVGSAPSTSAAPLVTGRLNRLLLTAIESHLGSPYHYAGTGPDSFDCSGFVWRTFQEAGFNFSRGPASSYWATFATPSKEDQYKFGTLVFFSGLAHVGIVADEHGFYHSSRHHGVIYSPFNEYWLSRVDGFRRVPVDTMPVPAASAKPRATNKTATNTLNVAEDNEP
jgi:cell wall-associated NlpC family hydrolase